MREQSSRPAESSIIVLQWHQYQTIFEANSSLGFTVAQNKMNKEG